MLTSVEEDCEHTRLALERFHTFQEALKRFRRLPCFYLLIDRDDRILRLGESGNLRARYKGGTDCALWLREENLCRSRPI
jgi:hypothetical protein